MSPTRWELKHLRKAWRYLRGSQNQSIDEEQTTQWPKEKKANKDLQNIHIKLKIE